MSATIAGKKYAGTRDTLEQAFMVADDLIHDKASDALKILDRTARWNNDPASAAQIKILKQLYKGRAIPIDLSKGMASRLISQAKNR